jgi:hypothetical protein
MTVLLDSCKNLFESLHRQVFWSSIRATCSPSDKGVLFYFIYFAGYNLRNQLLCIEILFSFIRLFNAIANDLKYWIRNLIESKLFFVLKTFNEIDNLISSPFCVSWLEISHELSPRNILVDFFTLLI